MTYVKRQLRDKQSESIWKRNIICAKLINFFFFFSNFKNIIVGFIKINLDIFGYNCIIL